jgi:S-adenosylmethionine hydrolase
MSPTITLLTDFGTADHYVAAMKGRILSIAPEAVLVDISHHVSPHDIHQGAYLLSSCWSDFPEGTIHLCVVDPGVGGSRRAMALQAEERIYVGPDNGLATYVLKAHENWSARELTRSDLFNHPVSYTFHGRDIFAPVAAHLANALPFEAVGSKLDHPYEIDIPTVTVRGKSLQGAVIHIDQFGNIVTNIQIENLGWIGLDENDLTMEIAGRSITAMARSYESGGNEPFLILGSGGYLEISVRKGSAAESLNAQVGTAVTVHN